MNCPNLHFLVVQEHDTSLKAHWGLELHIEHVITLTLLIHKANLVENVADSFHSFSPVFSKFGNELLGVSASIALPFIDELVKLLLSMVQVLLILVDQLDKLLGQFVSDNGFIVFSQDHVLDLILASDILSWSLNLLSDLL